MREARDAMTCQRGSEANYEYEVGMERDMKLVLLNEEKILKKDERTNEDVKNNTVDMKQA